VTRADVDAAARALVGLRARAAAGGQGSTRGKKSAARFAGAMAVWEALTGLEGDAALSAAYDRAQVSALEEDEAAPRRACSVCGRRVTEWHVPGVSLSCRGETLTDAVARHGAAAFRAAKDPRGAA
jgi:hypothetical protein